jgi:hypothetical protein
MGAIPVPTLCRLEYLTRKGWVTGHAMLNLLHPERYPERLAANGKVGRVTVLDEATLQPTSTTYESPLRPDPADIPESILERLVSRDVGNPDVPVLKAEDEDGDGSCLL